MTQNLQSKIQNLIKEMNHYDPDLMQTGAKGLTQLIIKGEIILENDPKMANIIRQNFMKQVQSQNDTVQSQAIQCLAQIVPKLPSDQIQLIFQKILAQTTNLNQTQKKRKNYGACALKVIHQTAEQFGKLLQNLLLKSIKLLLSLKDKNNELQAILIGVITQFVRKWPNIAAHIDYDRPQLTLYLLKNVQFKSNFDLIQKSQNCLGKLSLIFTKDLIQTCLQDKSWGLILAINKNKKQLSTQKLKQSRNCLYCLFQIIRGHNSQLRNWIRPITQLLLDIVNEHKSTEEIQNIDIICDILDSALTSLTLLLKTFNRELKQSLEHQSQKYRSFIPQIINFNVQLLMSYAGEPMQVEEEYQQEEDYYEEQQADQKCWKVRRAGLSYLSVLAKYDSQLLNKIGQGQLVKQLGNKLIQQQNMVSQMGFSTFNQLIDIISIKKNDDQDLLEGLQLQKVKSSALEIAEKLVQELKQKIRIVLNNTKFNDQLKIQSSKIFLKIIKIYRYIIVKDRNEFFLMIKFLIQEYKKTKIPENKSNLLYSVLELITSEFNYQQYKLIFNQIINFTKDNNVKIQYICLQIFRKFLNEFPQQISQDVQNINRVIELIKQKIKQHNNDKQVKIATSQCLSSLVQKYHLNDQQYLFFIEVLNQKLKIDIEKLYIVDTVSHLNIKQLKQSQIKAIQKLLKQIAQNLGCQSYQLNKKTIQAVDNLLRIIGNNCNQDIVDYLLEKSKIILNQNKIPQYFNRILPLYPKLFKPYSELIVKTNETQYILQLIKHKVINVNDCVKIIKQITKSKKISKTLGLIGYPQQQIVKEITEESPWMRILIGALGYAGNKNTISLLFSYLKKFSKEDTLQQICQAIGNIVSRYPDNLIPEIIKESSRADNLYHYIVIFRDMLEFTNNTFSASGLLLEWLFQKSENNLLIQSNNSVISECVGKLAALSPAYASEIYKQCSSNQNRRRFIVANSLKYALQKNKAIPYQYISAVISLYHDRQYLVRQSAIKSLISVVQLLKVNFFGQDQHQICQDLIYNCTINQDLIFTIDYGVCKEIRDDGKNLRLQSFAFLQLFIKKIHLENSLINQFLNVCLKNLSKQTSNDIILKRLGVIKVLVTEDFAPFLSLQDQFIASVSRKGGILQKFEKNDQEERTEVFLRNIIKQLNQINILGKKQGSDKLTAIIAQIKVNQRMNSILESLQKQ